MRSRRYGEPRVRLANDAQWPVRIDCGELGSFELKAAEAAQLAADLDEVLRQLGKKPTTRKKERNPWA